MTFKFRVSARVNPELDELHAIISLEISRSWIKTLGIMLIGVINSLFDIDVQGCDSEELN